MQSTAMIGPTMTLVSTGNLYQASLSYGANKAVEKETGMQTTEYLINKIEDNQKKDISREKLLSMMAGGEELDKLEVELKEIDRSSKN